MTTLRATPTAGGWRVRATRDRGGGGDEHADTEALHRGRRLLFEWFRGARDVDEAWTFEAAKAALGLGEIAIGYADRLAEACVDRPHEPHEIETSLPVPGRTIGFAFARRGLHVDASRRHGAIDALVAGAAYAAASLLWGLELVRRPRGQPLPTERPLLFALHGERSNRTRHLLRLLAGCRPVAVLVLGRPRETLASLQAGWTAEAGAPLPPLVRPWEARDGILALTEGWRGLRRAVRIAATQPWTPPARERVAQCFRMLQGAASAAWWSRQPAGRTCVVFGHTGLGDTVQLERAMQDAGSRTIHAVHGLSEGLNFTGVSDVAIWRSSVDAEWHAKAGGYGANRAVEMDRPPARSPGQGALVLTNLAHPMNTAYRLRGPMPEIQALEAAAAAAHAGPIAWKPHPAFHRLPDDVRTRVRAHASALAIEELAAGTDAIDRALDAGEVFTTASTVVPELLTLGIAPRLVGSRDWVTHLALRRLVTRDEEMRTTVVDDRFDAAWDAVRPAAPLTVERVLAETRT